MPVPLNSGKVKLQGHNFFDPQPQKNASIFLMKQVMHDWADDSCAKILTQLRDAATTQTKLIVVDSIMPFACHDPSQDAEKGVPGAIPREAPEPLLANFGAVNEMVSDSITAFM